MKKVEKKAKSKKKSLFKNIPWVLWLIFLACTVILFNLNPVRSSVLIAFLSVWALISKRKTPVISSILLFLLALPFNLTLSLPSLVDPYIGGVYVNYLVPAISILDIFIILFLSSYISANPDLTVLRKRLPKGIYLFAAYLLLHIFIHPQISVAINSIRIFLYSLGIWFGVQEVKKQRLTTPIMKVFLFGIVVQSVIGLLQFALGKSLGLEFLGESKLLTGALGTSFIKLSNGEFLRAYGTFPHPNVLAGYLLFSFITSWAAYYIVKERRFSFWGMILSSFLLLFTFSRVTILLWFLSIIVLGWTSLKGSGLSILIFERFTSILSNSDYSLSDRVKLNNEAVRIIKQRLLDGLGAGNFTKALESSIPYSANGFSLIQPVHNIFLLILSEHGVIAGLAIIFGLAAWKIRQIMSSSGAQKIFLILAAICILTIGMFDHYLITLPQGLSILLISLFL